MNTSETFEIGLIQQACQNDSRENLDKACAGIEKLAAQGAQIICLPELFRTRYFCTIEEAEQFRFAETIPGPTTSVLQKIAQNLEVVLLAPIFEQRAPGLYHNSTAVIDADGSLLGVYRKMHIPHDPLYFEKYYFTPGDAGGDHSGFRVFRTRYASIGVLICWDQWYPEAARITSLLGAEVLFYPTAIGWHPSEKKEHGESQQEAWKTIQRSHAIANGVYVAAVNRVGFEPTPGTDGIEFFGSSFVSDPFGRFEASCAADKEEQVVVTCKRAEIEKTRQDWPFLRDRRVDSYSPILARYIDR